MAKKADSARFFISFVDTQTHVPGLHAFVAFAQTLEIPPSELMRRVDRKMEMFQEKENEFGKHLKQSIGVDTCH